MLLQDFTSKQTMWKINHPNNMAAFSSTYYMFISLSFYERLKFNPLRKHNFVQDLASTPKVNFAWKPQNTNKGFDLFVVAAIYVLRVAKRLGWRKMSLCAYIKYIWTCGHICQVKYVFTYIYKYVCKCELVSRKTQTKIKRIRQIRWKAKLWGICV